MAVLTRYAVPHQVPRTPWTKSHQVRRPASPTGGQYGTAADPAITATILTDGIVANAVATTPPLLLINDQALNRASNW